jgi:hypothetical protein
MDGVESTSDMAGCVMSGFPPSVLIPPASMTRYRLAVAACLSALTLLGMAGCSSGAAGTSGLAKTSTSGPAQASPSRPTAQTYVSRAFVVPLALSVDPALKSPPNPDSRNLLSWDAAVSAENKVRFLVPVNLYPPLSHTPEAPPKDYLAYLRGLTRYGVMLSDVTKVTVGGHPATLMTVNSTASPGILDGDIGCPEVGADRDEGCFGAPSDLSLRLAVIPLRNGTLLAWARTPEPSDANFFVTFERMLSSIRFR